MQTYKEILIYQLKKDNKWYSGNIVVSLLKQEYTSKIHSTFLNFPHLLIINRCYYI